jgi:hypothetical protein
MSSLRSAPASLLTVAFGQLVLIVAHPAARSARFHATPDDRDPIRSKVPGESTEDARVGLAQDFI